MIDWRGLTSKDHLVLMKNAIDRMAEILNDSSVIALWPDAYDQPEVDKLDQGRAALRSIVENPNQVQRLRNAEQMAIAARGLEMAQVMLARPEFLPAKGEGWSERDRRVIEIALGEYERATAYQRN